MKIKLEIFLDELKENSELSELVETAKDTGQFNLLSRTYIVLQQQFESFSGAHIFSRPNYRDKITIYAEMIQWAENSNE